MKDEQGAGGSFTVNSSHFIIIIIFQSKEEFGETGEAGDAGVYGS